MPVNEFSGPWGWGYDGVDLYAPHHAYGRPDDLKALVKRVMPKAWPCLLDVVYNHLGRAATTSRVRPVLHGGVHNAMGIGSQSGPQRQP